MVSRETPALTEGIGAAVISEEPGSNRGAMASSLPRSVGTRSTRLLVAGEGPWPSVVVIVSDDGGRGSVTSAVLWASRESSVAPNSGPGDVDVRSAGADAETAASTPSRATAAAESDVVDGSSVRPALVSEASVVDAEGGVSRDFGTGSGCGTRASPAPCAAGTAASPCVAVVESRRAAVGPSGCSEETVSAAASPTISRMMSSSRRSAGVGVWWWGGVTASGVAGSSLSAAAVAASQS